jgi:hypothetical protein
MIKNMLLLAILYIFPYFSFKNYSIVPIYFISKNKISKYNTLKLKVEENTIYAAGLLTSYY